MSMLAPAPVRCEKCLYGGGRNIELNSELITIYQCQCFLKLFFETNFFFILSLTCCKE